MQDFCCCVFQTHGTITWYMITDGIGKYFISLYMQKGPVSRYLKRHSLYYTKYPVLWLNDFCEVHKGCFHNVKRQIGMSLG